MDNHIQAKVLLAQAELVRVEGMKADNQQRVHKGEYAVYSEDDFNSSASYIIQLAEAIKEY